MHRWRRAVPVLVSAALVAWVIYRVSLTDLAEAALRLDWPALVLLTTGLVFALYLWDAFCVRWLFTEPEAPLSYGRTLHARGLAYLAGALNYEAGQGLLAWMLARTQGITLLAALGRCVLLSIHDIAVLLSLGLLGAALSTDARAPAIRLFCGIGLLGMIGAALFVSWMPAQWRQRWEANRLGIGLHGWTWGRSVRLYLLRVSYYMLYLVYAAAALPLCGIDFAAGQVFSVVPLVLLADGLPISVSGLGTRETALLYLLNPGPQVKGALLAFSLIWSTGLLAGRAAIGLGHWWLPRGTVWLRAMERKPDDHVGDGSHRLCRQPHHG